MRRLFPILVLLAVAALGGCAGAGYVKPNPFERFPQRANIYDVQFAWRTVPAADAVEVEGIAKNVRYPFMNDLELHLSLLDRDNRVVARGTAFPMPSPIPMDQWRPFQITLKAAPPPGGRLRFLYTYTADESPDHFSWMNSFDADLATGAVIRKEE